MRQLYAGAWLNLVTLLAAPFCEELKSRSRAVRVLEHFQKIKEFLDGGVCAVFGATRLNLAADDEGRCRAAPSPTVRITVTSHCETFENDVFLKSVTVAWIGTLLH